MKENYKQMYADKVDFGEEEIVLDEGEMMVLRESLKKDRKKREQMELKQSGGEIDE